MRLKGILKSNFNLLKGTGLALIIIIAADFLSNVIRLILGQHWSKTFDLNHSLAIGALSIVFIVTMAMLVSQNFSIFAQFNVPRKDQFKGNLLTILICSVGLMVTFHLIYPLVLPLFFDQVIPIKATNFVANGMLNSGLNGLDNLIQLLSAGLGGYFIATFIRRFSIKWLVLLFVAMVIFIPSLLIISMLTLPKEVIDLINDFFSPVSAHPAIYFSMNILELAFSSWLIWLMTKRLSLK